MRARSGALWLTALCAALGACTLPLPEQRPAQTTAPAGVSPAGLATSIEHGVFEEINRLRAGQRLARLRRADSLDRAARAHAQELAERGELDHDSRDPQRRTPGMRASAEGVAWMSIAENLAAMTDDGSGVPGRTGSMWLGSPAHRANMLSARYTHTGVGVAIDRRGVWYVTQLYVLPR